MSQINHFSFPSADTTEGEKILHPKVVEKNLQYLDATDSLCRGISDNVIEARGDLLRQAALDGDARAMVCYAKSTMDVGPRYLTDGWFNYADRWSQEAPSLAQQAFDLGQPDVIPLLIDAYVPSTPSTMKSYQFSELISPDAQTAYGLALLYRRLVPASSAGGAEAVAAKLREGLSTDQQSAAQKFADANWPKFAGSVVSEKNVDPCFGEY